MFGYASVKCALSSYLADEYLESQAGTSLGTAFSPASSP
jgi:hypothetical protein